MNKEDKKLLLRDLCARLPYGVKCEVKYYDDAWELLAIYTNGTTYAARDIGYPIETCFEDCKPYLFPLSSMTEEKIEELLDIVIPTNNGSGIIEESNIGKYMDWCYKNHFDYNGLIPKGLANDATGLNIY